MKKLSFFILFNIAIFGINHFVFGQQKVSKYGYKWSYPEDWWKLKSTDALELMPYEEFNTATQINIKSIPLNQENLEAATEELRKFIRSELTLFGGKDLGMHSQESINIEGIQAKLYEGRHFDSYQDPTDWICFVTWKDKEEAIIVLGWVFDDGDPVEATQYLEEVREVILSIRSKR